MPHEVSFDVDGRFVRLVKVDVTVDDRGETYVTFVLTHLDTPEDRGAE